MSVIVLGMEMPEYCGKCDFEPCTKWKNHEPMTRPDDCPLRFLPEKHGRLVDIDAIMEEIKNSRIFKGDSLIALMDIVDGARTIVEAEGD